EPDPVLFGHLSENVRRNCTHANVELHCCALGSQNGSAKFAIDPEGNRGDNRIIPFGTSDPDWRTIEVPIRRLDDFIFPQGPLGVKIDTQGYEPFVITGGTTTLNRAKLVVLEFWPWGIAKSGGDCSIIVDFISRFEEAAIAPG